MTKDIQQRIEEMNPDTVDWNDAGTYAALGVGDDDGTASEGAPLGDTIEEQAAADAKASAPAQAASVPAKTEEPPKTESSETPNAAAQAKPDEQVDGVATRDGKRVIPYAVLKTARDELRAREQALQEKEAELARLKEQLAAKAADTGNAAVDKAMANPAKLSEAQIEKIRVDFPEVADALEAMREQLATVQAAKAEQPKPAAVTEPAKAAQPNVEDEDEAFDQGLIANPMLASWMAKPSEKPWQRAVAIDKMLSQDPEYAGKTYADRFAVVERMVAAELGIAAPKTEPKPEPVLNVAQAPVKQAARPSLSDLGGTAPRSEDDVWAQSTAVDLLARADKMSEQELMRLAGINY